MPRRAGSARGNQSWPNYSKSGPDFVDAAQPQKDTLRSRLEVGVVPSAKEVDMNAFLLMAGSGPLLILTSHRSIEDKSLLDKLLAKGIDKFISYPVPDELARERYGGHYQVVVNDLHETDDLRVLDYNGERAFRLFRFDELGKPHMHEA
jgi:hypothetical protein